MNDAIQLENLTKRYPNFSLDNVSLSLPRGCIMGLIGKNGAGKTTTLKLLLGLRRPDGGKITLLGLPLEGHEAEIKSRLGVALDDNRFSEAFSPKDVNRILRLVHSRWDETYFRSLADRFGLPWTMPLKKYSRGMKMKLSLSAALAHRPELLIMDEATSGLDPVARDEILDMLQEFISDGSHSVLLSSHITDDLEKVCDYISFLDKGRLVFSEDRERLRERYGVVRAGQSALAALPKDHILGVKQGSLGMEALVDNRMELTAAHPDWVIDPASLAEIMVLYGREK